MSNLRVLDEAYVEALAQRDFAGVAAYLHPQVAFRALVPAGVREAEDADGALAWLRRWFGDADVLAVLQQATDDSLGCLAMSYRFQVRKQDVWQVIEQQAFCKASDGQIERIHLVCSGFLPVAGPEHVGQARQSWAAPTDSAVETSTQLPHADRMLDALGEGCATLTPLIGARIRELESGQMLDVRTDDPAAHASLEAWCRLTGHTLTAVSANGSQSQRFLIRKK